MSISIKNELKLYNSNPYDYVHSLPDSIESVDLILQLMQPEYQAYDIENTMMRACILSPIYITESTAPLESRLNLLYLSYFTGSAGITDVSEYYKDHYNGPIETFDIHAHLELVSMFYTRIVRDDNLDSLFENWFISGLLGTSDVLDTLYTHRTEFDKTKLAGLMPLSYMFEQPQVDLSKSLTNSPNKSLANLKIRLEQFAQYIYGEHLDKVTVLARALNLTGDVNYWQSSVSTPASEDSYDLPTLL